jgi:hypothetical protein
VADQQYDGGTILTLDDEGDIRKGADVITVKTIPQKRKKKGRSFCALALRRRYEYTVLRSWPWLRTAWSYRRTWSALCPSSPL